MRSTSTATPLARPNRPEWAAVTRSVIYTQEHDELRDSVRRFVDKELRPHVDEWEDAGFFPDDVFRRCGELGFLGPAAAGLRLCLLPPLAISFDAGGFLEWFEVYGDLKGTPIAPVLANTGADLSNALEVILSKNQHLAILHRARRGLFDDRLPMGRLARSD